MLKQMQKQVLEPLLSKSSSNSPSRSQAVPDPVPSFSLWYSHPSNVEFRNARAGARWMDGSEAGNTFPVGVVQ